MKLVMRFADGDAAEAAIDVLNPDAAPVVIDATIVITDFPMTAKVDDVLRDMAGAGHTVLTYQLIFGDVQPRRAAGAQDTTPAADAPTAADVIPLRRDYPTAGTMTKYEWSLLLFFECAFTDRGGLLSTAHMNADDMKIKDRWCASGFITWQRVHSMHLNGETAARNHVVFLSTAAQELAFEGRRQRAERCWANRHRRTITEYKAEQDHEDGANV